jgi:TRAP transporter TAXI family solute receptor
MKKNGLTRGLIIFSTMVIFLLLGMTGGFAADKKMYTMSSSDIGGVWFVIGATFTTQWNAEIPNVIWSCDTRGGGGTNAYWSALGKVDAAINFMPSFQSAIKGTGFFKDKGPQDMSNVASVMDLYGVYITVVVKKDSDLEYIEDIRGRRVAVEQPGAAPQTMLPWFADVWGWGDYKKEIKCEYIADYDALDAVISGRIDAYFATMGLGGAAISEAFERADLKILKAKDSTLEKMKAKYPIVVAGEIPAGTYKGQEAVRVPNCRSVLHVQKSLPDDLVYQMSKVIYTHLKDGTLASTHRCFKESGFPPYIEKMSMSPLHPGAKKFYNEIGVKLE